MAKKWDDAVFFEMNREKVFLEEIGKLSLGLMNKVYLPKYVPGDVVSAWYTSRYLKKAVKNFITDNFSEIYGEYRQKILSSNTEEYKEFYDQFIFIIKKGTEGDIDEFLDEDMLVVPPMVITSILSWNALFIKLLEVLTPLSCLDELDYD